MRSVVFFFQAEDGIRDGHVTGVQSVLFRSLPGGGAAGMNGQRWQIGAVGAWALVVAAVAARSEERRVGKECRSRWGPQHREKTSQVKRGVAQKEEPRVSAAAAYTSEPDSEV